MIEVGEKYLVTTDNWFYAPDGNQYRAAFGTANGIFDDKDALGIATNRHSSNWYANIGNLIIAGCQIHYLVKTDSVSFAPPAAELEHEGNVSSCQWRLSRIYNADSGEGASE